MLTRISHHFSRAMARLVRLVVGLIITALMLLTAAQQVANVGPWWLELSRYVPYPAYVLPALLALLLSCRLSRAWLVASAATLALVLTVTMGLVWPRPDVGGTPLRLMTYNVKAYLAARHGGGFDRLAQEVALHHPDILVMQDAHEAHPGSDHSVFESGPVFGYPHVHAVDQYVVASRFPLRDCALRHIGWRGEELAYVHCVVEAKGGELDLVTVHFESPRSGLNAARREGLEGAADWQRNFRERLDQSRALAGALAHGLAGRGRPLVLAGDLNAPEASSVIRTLLALGLRDAFSTAGRGYGYSYGQALKLGFSFLRIDHILVSPEIGVAGCFVGNGEASEHRPVIADLLLRP
ncbi:MAG: endonuclease/exonuclease/phosphatase family protein [Bacteriovorax sp.]|nr:endonuclease/exonuclease/phosphatase family protein [Rhizobacter sp.]